ncbi:hypothetical protein V8C86DRAFT_1460729 [Haematococcus lacustris]
MTEYTAAEQALLDKFQALLQKRKDDAEKRAKQAAGSRQQTSQPSAAPGLPFLFATTPAAAKPDTPAANVPPVEDKKELTAKERLRLALEAKKAGLPSPAAPTQLKAPSAAGRARPQFANVPATPSYSYQQDPSSFQDYPDLDTGPPSPSGAPAPVVVQPPTTSTAPVYSRPPSAAPAYSRPPSSSGPSYSRPPPGSLTAGQPAYSRPPPAPSGTSSLPYSRPPSSAPPPSSHAPRHASTATAQPPPSSSSFSAHAGPGLPGGLKRSTVGGGEVGREAGEGEAAAAKRARTTAAP